MDWGEEQRWPGTLKESETLPEGVRMELSAGGMQGRYWREGEPARSAAVGIRPPHNDWMMEFRERGVLKGRCAVETAERAQSLARVYVEKGRIPALARRLARVLRGPARVREGLVLQMQGLPAQAFYWTLGKQPGRRSMIERTGEPRRRWKVRFQHPRKMDRVVWARTDAAAHNMAQEFVANGELPEGAVIDREKRRGQ